MADELCKEAQIVIKGYLEKGAGKDLSIQRYDEAAKNYDKYMEVTQYQGPTELAKTMKKLFSDNYDNMKILDVACGTGLSGQKLWGIGFRHIDAVDSSQGMLDVAKEKKVYERLICDFVDDKHQLDVPDNTYDAITIVGGMGENQLPSGSFGEMIRLVKPGGYIVNVTRVEHYDLVDDYRTNLKPFFQKLEEEGKWKEVSSTKFPNFIMDREGTVTIHRVLV